MPHLRLKWPRHTTVVAYLSLFLVLSGGTALAFKLKANSVKSKHIAPDAVTGEDANEATFGKVPSAQHSDTADTATTANSASTAETANTANFANSVGSVGPNEIQNPTRSINLPLTAFVNRSDQAPIDFTASNGTAPDFVQTSTNLQLEWDDDADGAGGDVGDTDLVATTFMVPLDFASDPTIAPRISKDGHSGVQEFFSCSSHIDEQAGGGNGRATTGVAPTTYAFPAGNASGYAPGVAVTLSCSVDGGVGGNTFDDRVRLLSIEFRYTATQ
ncbi:MAG TPA: hypothetical protein VEK39_05055 [Solirubrobacterales bacterium]|nr:hypothetical protein [Solirubrobacterales bacterium]